jgi:sortase A
MRHRETNPLTGRTVQIISALLLVSGLLLLSGCSVPGIGNVDSNVQGVNRPVPPVQPANFDAFAGGDREPDRIAIPSIGLDTKIDDLGWSAATDPAGRIFNNWDVTANAAGWHINSDSLGDGGNVVLSGHNNILGAVFRELDQLDTGDVATVWSGGKQYDYEIDEVFIVPERDATYEQRLENARWIGEFDDNRLTLVTCWPRDGNSHRIIAIGHFVSDASSGS